MENGCHGASFFCDNKSLPTFKRSCSIYECDTGDAQYCLESLLNPGFLTYHFLDDPFPGHAESSSPTLAVPVPFLVLFSLLHLRTTIITICITVKSSIIAGQLCKTNNKCSNNNIVIFFKVARHDKLQNGRDLCPDF